MAAHGSTCAANPASARATSASTPAASAIISRGWPSRRVAEIDRPATSAQEPDAAQPAAILAAAARAHLPALVALEAAFPTDRFSRASWRRLIASPTAHVRVALNPETGAVLGAAALLTPRRWRRGRLYSLAVAAEARGRGVGAALVGAMEALACDAGKVGVSLEVRVDNAIARAFYHKLGYEPAGLRLQYYADGANALRLIKDRAREATVHP